MIIVKLKGGLGNQLFQYALGRNLSEIHKTILKIDISFFQTYALHAYSLGPFDIREIIASQDEVVSLKYQKTGTIERAMMRLLRKSRSLAKSYIKEKDFHYDPEILSLPDGVYLDGYWQSDKYSADISEIIRQEFKVKPHAEGKNLELLEDISSCESVSLHIRRGSYLIPPYNSVLEPCSLTYYQKCVDYLAYAINNPHFYIFSDDPQWTRDNLQLSYPFTFVDQNNADKDYEDLRLISHCKHHIIANSTFSWWGAWLNDSKDKIVIAPQKWFNDTSVNTEDLIPPTWIRL
jgi:hypothetical protein